MSESEFDIHITDLAEADLDRQPFGIIRLDPDGTVRSFNRYEQELSRFKKEDVLGKNFFREVAPCTKVKEFYGRFREGVEKRELNVTFGFVFAFTFGARNVDVSLFYKKSDDSVWVIVRGG